MNEYVRFNKEGEAVAGPALAAFLAGKRAEWLEERYVAAAYEAEGSALIGAQPCPDNHEPEGLSGFLARIGATACPTCGATS